MLREVMLREKSKEKVRKVKVVKKNWYRATRGLLPLE